jgi:hypothetical protein
VQSVGVLKTWLPVDGISVFGIKFKSVILTDRLVIEKIETNRQYLGDREGQRAHIALLTVRFES